MEDRRFQWTPFYEEFADKLLAPNLLFSRTNPFPKFLNIFAQSSQRSQSPLLGLNPILSIP